MHSCTRNTAIAEVKNISERDTSVLLAVSNSVYPREDYREIKDQACCKWCVPVQDTSETGDVLCPSSIT